MGWFTKRRSKRDAIAAHVAILKDVNAGRFDDHPCPQCGQPKVSAWFLRARGSHFVLCMCGACGYEFQTVGSPPPSFTEDRVHHAREAAWQQLPAKFQRPDCDNPEGAEQGEA